jgi:hypothetical protein
MAALGELIGECDRLRFLDETCNIDLISEMRWSPEEGERERDGLTLDNLELGRGDRAALQMLRSWKSLRLVRAWGGGRVFTRASIDAITNSGAVGLVTMPGRGRATICTVGAPASACGWWPSRCIWRSTR